MVVLTACAPANGNIDTPAKSSDINPTRNMTSTQSTHTITAEPAEITPKSTRLVTSSNTWPLPPKASFVENLSDYIQIKLSDINKLHGSFLVFQGDSPLGENPVALDIVDREGERYSFLIVDHVTAENDELKAFSAVPKSAESDSSLIILLYSGNNGEDSEIYAFNTQTGEAWSLITGCAYLYPSDIAVGSDYFTFRCFETPNTWYFISVQDPTKALARELPLSAEEIVDFRPLWISSTTLLFVKSTHRAVCMVNVNEWQPVCKDLSFWLGPVSPDGSWFEIRSDDDIHPSQIALMEVSCLKSKNDQCTASLPISTPFLSPIGTSRYLLDSVWLADSSGLEFIVGVENASEVWSYNLTNRKLTLRYTLSDLYHFGDPRFALAHAPWYPTEQSVVVSDGMEFSILDIESGDLTPLTEGGILLGEITLP